jgi:hypothetical protein
MIQASTIGRSTAAPEPSALSCELRLLDRVNRAGRQKYLGELILTNRTTSTIQVPYRMTALQHLALLVTDSSGRVLSEGHFGDRFAPTLEPGDLRLAPGESFVAVVPLFATVRSEQRLPGTYTITAIYECGSLRAASDPLTVAVA